MTEKTRFGHLQVPLKRVHIELTNACEFGCRFCPKSIMERSYGFMDKELGKKIISEVAQNNIAEKVTFHVMGEPTMHPDFFEFLEHAAAVGQKVGLTTNGRNLGGAVGKRLLDYPLHQLDISFQTPTEESFPLREAGKLTFQEYLDGIMDFFTEYRRRWPQTIIKFRFLNTIFPVKTLEKVAGPIKVMSSTKELRATFKEWVQNIHRRLGVEEADTQEALRRVDGLVSYKWNVVEILPNLFFETYILEDWGHAFTGGKVYDAWAGYCFGMRDHFAILQNGDVTLCCIDFSGKTVIGNLNNNSLEEVLSTDEFGEIMAGFAKFRPVHPYCKRCMGSATRLSWLLKPVLGVLALGALKPFFHKKTKLFTEK
ncbi:MAG: radical SAM protein [Nitrospinota bacterium]|nr:radical SAM protein [Nitrospinota bacterium]